MKPLVSILIPAFNAEEWIADTLRSALAQTWERREIIVVDDGSTDQTLAVARSFESESVRVVAQKNQGSSAARNTALSLHHGDYVQWLDADDLLAPDKIARQMEALTQVRSSYTLLSAEWGQFLYRHYRAKFRPTALWGDLTPVEWLLRKMGQNLYMPNSTWLVSRELTDAAGPWDTELFVDDDGEYFCRVLLQSDGVRFVPRARAYYRASGSGSVSHIGCSNRKLENQLRSMKLHIGYLRSLEDSERVRVASVTFLQNWLLHFYQERLDLVEQAQQMARELGGQLEAPSLSWKYSWIKAAFGWSLAKRSQDALRQLRWSVARYWDKALFRLETSRGSNHTA